jgi:hypothetical protein
VAKLAGALGLDAARLQALARTTAEPARTSGRHRPGAAGLQLKVMGPVEAWREGTRIELSEPRQRAVLALLALNPNVAVHRETLIDAVWGENPPGAAAQRMQTYVSRLRRMLDPGRPPRDPRGLLVSAGTSYRLHVTADQLKRVTRSSARNPGCREVMKAGCRDRRAGGAARPGSRGAAGKGGQLCVSWRKFRTALLNASGASMLQA